MGSFLLEPVVQLLAAFYSSFLREHKVLRYYANPLSSFYAIYKSAKKALVTEQREFIEIGKDAIVPASDVDRELIVMVIG
jgi:lipid A ethanolaminephosphotransferase